MTNKAVDSAVFPVHKSSSFVNIIPGESLGVETHPHEPVLPGMITRVDFPSSFAENKVVEPAQIYEGTSRFHLPL